MRRVIRPTMSIATNTFREATRNKVLGSLVFFVVLASAGSALFGEMSLHQNERVTADGVLFMSTIFSVVIAIYSTVTLLHNEIERRTIYTILSKPIARWQFLLGKFLGVALLLLVIVGCLLPLAVVLLHLQGGSFHVSMVWAYCTLYMQLVIVTAVTLLFASFSSPLLSGMFTAAIFVAGNLVTQLEAAKTYLEQAGGGLEKIIDLLLIVLPNFESLNLSWFVTHQEPLPLSYMAAAGWYTLSYVALAVGLSMLIFKRRDFV